MQEEATHELPDFTTDNLEEFITYHREMIQRIAQIKGRNLSYAEPDDLEQAMMEHIVRYWHLFSEQPAWRVKSFFEKAANQYLAKERNDYMHFSAAFIYRPEDVRRHLEESAWRDGEDCPDVDAKVDLAAAFKSIAKSRQKAIYKRYGLGVPFAELTKSEENAMYRGVDDMTAWLNRKEQIRTYSFDELRGKVFSQL